MATKKKATKATKKKTAAKPLKRKDVAPSGSSEINIKTVRYRCQGGFCKATPHERKLKPGDLVMLFAIETEATINFTAGSPFVSGTTQFVLPPGGIQFEVVAEISGTRQPFKYDLTCTECPSLFDPPVMIVET